MNKQHQIDFVFQNRSGITAFKAIAQKQPSKEDLKTGALFLEQFSKAKIAYVSWDGTPEILHSRAVTIPARFVL